MDMGLYVNNVMHYAVQECKVITTKEFLNRCCKCKHQAWTTCYTDNKCPSRFKHSLCYFCGELRTKFKTEEERAKLLTEECELFAEKK